MSTGTSLSGQSGGSWRAARPVLSSCCRVMVGGLLVVTGGWWSQPVPSVVCRGNQWYSGASIVALLTNRTNQLYDTGAGFGGGTLYISFPFCVFVMFVVIKATEN